MKPGLPGYQALPGQTFHPVSAYRAHADDNPVLDQLVFKFGV